MPWQDGGALRLLGLVTFVALSACGDAAARPKPAATATTPNGPAAPAERNAVATTPATVVAANRHGTVGALERASSMRRFFESLARLEDGRMQDDVRIIQFGDSHTAADIQSAAARRGLQARFGDGGRGFVAIGRPWKLYRAEGVRGGMSSDWSSDKAKLGPHPTTDGVYGLAGIGLVTRNGGARAWTDITVKTAKAEVAYFEQPGGGSFDVLVDGLRVVRVSTRSPGGSASASAFRTFDVAENSPHQLEIRAVGDGEVRVFGVALDRAQHGVVYDALGINGARINQPLAWSELHWAEQLRHRNPAMIVLAYGTNESVDEAMPAQTYERQLVDLLGRMSRAVPGASCLLLGPPDRAIDMKDGTGFATAPKIVEIIQSQRRVAEAAGCAFYDQMAAMGGEGSMAAWALEDPPRAQKDRVHLTKEGYSQLGSAFASDVMRAYAQWRKDNGLPNSPARHVDPPPLNSNGLPALPVPGDNTEP